MKHWTRAERAERLANALTDTSERYYRGCMSHPTWKSHIASLWGTIDAEGLRENVMELVDPARVGLRPTHEQQIGWRTA